MSIDGTAKKTAIPRVDLCCNLLSYLAIRLPDPMSLRQKLMWQQNHRTQLVPHTVTTDLIIIHRWIVIDISVVARAVI
jgi:hypothetical protein